MNSETRKKIWTNYRYACAVLVLGLILLWFPGRKSDAETDTDTMPVQSSQSTENAEQQLSDILSKTKGVGEVRVVV